MTTRSVLGLAVLSAVLAAGCGDDNPSTPTSLFNSGGTSSGSQDGNCNRPSTPTGLRVTAKTGNVVELTWNAVAGATGYTLLIGSNPGGTDVLNANTVNPTFRLTARDGKQYARVQTESRCGASNTSPSIEFTIP